MKSVMYTYGLDTETVTIDQAIAYYKRGINEDIFKEPVASYAKMAVAALEKVKKECEAE